MLPVNSLTCTPAKIADLLLRKESVEAEIGRYYETPDYISHSDTKKGAMNAIYHHVRQYMLGRKARLVMKESHRKTRRILDIGTGTGYFAHTMQNRGWEVEAVEKSGQARNFAREHFGLNVRPEAALKELVRERSM